MGSRGKSRNRPDTRRFSNRRLTTGFFSVPTPSTVTSTVSPGCNGPTPAGVPVAIRSPGSSVITCEMKWMSTSSGKRKSTVVPFCRIWPFTRVCTPHALPRIEVCHHHRADGTKGVEPFGASPLTIFFLQVARGHVVHAGIAKYVRPYVIALAQAVAALADHDSQLAFVVHALRERVGPANVVAGGDDRRRRL